ncbi:Uncharacterized membrane protein YoaK, UPF0700 family [Faunimonas pinastri]|uniref:Uncharacterized membrane protein YoaK, UPF0700 family n=1 Tax=Faunimonas pinastri TaxID=1855383 RepID=A0A1H9APH4_9HYPH|nr:YoaK family protein [Faunimonas pinastri]SEP78559.1 Uncharacterized membrane protein YoaK, UPF0700 family [Faunimonas pinastri]
MPDRDTPASQRKRIIYGFLLTGVAGWVDAIGFLRLGGLYTSFMSGNTTQLGIALSHGGNGLAVAAFALVMLFVAGSFVGTILMLKVKPRPVPMLLLLEGVILSVAAALSVKTGVLVGMLPLAFAMGLQNSTLGSAGDAHLGVTFVSGTLYRFGRDIARRVVGETGGWEWTRNGLIWLSLMVGALCGALSYAAFEVYGLGFPAVIVLMLALWATRFASATTVRDH